MVPFVFTFFFDQSVKCGHTSKQSSKQANNLFLLLFSTRKRITIARCRGDSTQLSQDDADRLCAIQFYADHIRAVYNRHDPFRKQDSVDPAIEH
jgi:hypothetical protein